MKPNVKKLLILNLPYLFFVWLFMKVGEAYRLTPGTDLSGYKMSRPNVQKILYKNVQLVCLS